VKADKVSKRKRKKDNDVLLRVYSKDVFYLYPRRQGGMDRIENIENAELQSEQWRSRPEKRPRTPFLSV